MQNPGRNGNLLVCWRRRLRNFRALGDRAFAMPGLEHMRPMNKLVTEERMDNSHEEKHRSPEVDGLLLNSILQHIPNPAYLRITVTVEWRRELLTWFEGAGGDCMGDCEEKHQQEQRECKTTLKRGRGRPVHFWAQAGPEPQQTLA